MDIKKLVEEEAPQLIQWRRHFHEYPEGSQHEFKTMEYIEGYLKEWNIPFVKVPHGGILGTIDSGKPGFTVLMRADMDALPIEEDPINLKKHKIVVSKNKGFSHACGHDGHMSMLLTEAKILAAHRDEWEGKVIVMFEEAEEFGERGVGHLLAYLRDNKIHVDACYGTHVRWDVPAGKMGILDGGVMAGAFFFRVKLHGKGGHGSRPDLSLNPVDAFLAIAGDLQSFRVRSVAPDHCLTYSFGCVQAGHEPNVIPEELMFAGSCRFFTEEDGQKFRTLFHQIVDSESANFGCRAEIVEDQYFTVTTNDPTCAALARKAVEKEVGPDVLTEPERWMASETFAVTLAEYPGILAFTGIKDDEVGSGANHHTAKFDIGEKGLITGAESALAYVLALLKEKPDLSHFKSADLDKMIAIM